jgi:hypothetical protein
MKPNNIIEDAYNTMLSIGIYYHQNEKKYSATYLKKPNIFNNKYIAHILIEEYGGHDYNEVTDDNSLTENNSGMEFISLNADNLISNREIGLILKPNSLINKNLIFRGSTKIFLNGKLESVHIYILNKYNEQVDVSLPTLLDETEKEESMSHSSNPKVINKNIKFKMVNPQ